ncbi:MAG: ABC transporter permease [Clostridiaceae bacterium]|nr:ABC transporter permease [Clostridiaceae bacterium]
MDFIINILNLLKERSDFFIGLLVEHIIMSAEAAIIICIIGITLGVFITRYKKIAKFVLTITNFIYTVPSIALFGFLVTITGIGNTSALIALVVYGLLPVIRNTYVGIIEVDYQIVESAIAMGSTDRQLLFKVQLPLALPVIMSGLRTMIIMTIALGGIASFIGAGGLGVAIWRGITTNFPEMTAAGSLLVALLAISCDGMMGLIDKRIQIKIYKK